MYKVVDFFIYKSHAFDNFTLDFCASIGISTPMGRLAAVALDQIRFVLYMKTDILKDTQA